MGFAAGTVSYQRFFLTGPFPTEVDDAFVKALQHRAFGRGPVRPDGTQIGWVGPAHLLDSDLSGPHIACGSFVHVGLRVDTLRVPPAVLRAYRQLEEDTARETDGHATLSSFARRKAREAAAARAAQDVKSGAHRRMAVYPVLIDLADRAVYLGSVSPTVAERLLVHLSDTFGAGLEPAGPGEVAGRVLEAARRARALEGLAPFALVDPPDGAGEEAIQPAEGELRFLGKEFCTWLWHQVESDNGPLKVRAGDEVSVLIERVLRLKCDFGLTGADTIAADQPAGLPEARAALRVGKQPVRMGLLLAAPAGEYRLTLDGPRLAVSGLTLPEPEDDLAGEALREQRFEQITDVAHLLDALFELFVTARTGRGWDALLRKMTTWARGAREGALRSAASA